MVKKSIAFIFGLLWLLNFTVPLTTVSSAESKDSQMKQLATLQEVTTPSMLLLLPTDKPITPPFTIDWGLWSNFNSTWTALQILTKDLSLSFPLFKKSFSLFDVKETFIQFFYTW
jgi:hypothetical protein